MSDKEEPKFPSDDIKHRRDNVIESESFRPHHSLNINVRGLRESPTLTIAETCRQIQLAGTNVYIFGLGQSPFPIPEPMVDSLKLYSHEKVYLPVRGMPELREAIASFHKGTDGVFSQPDLILIGPGSKELMFLLQMSFYGEVLLPSPCWVSYGPQAKILGKQLRVIPTRFEDRWHLTPEGLEEFLKSEKDDDRPRLLVLNTPGNPDGLAYSRRHLEDIARICRSYGVIVLSDEIYGMIHHTGEHVSIGRFYPEGTILSSGISKWCAAGGWRLGTMVFPPALKWLLDAMAGIASETYSSVCTPVQYAAITAFRGGAFISRYLIHSRRILSGLGMRGHKILTESGIRLHPPEGAFYLFPDFSLLKEKLADKGITDSVILCNKLLEEASVAILPGVDFERPLEELTARLAYVNFDGASALTASEAIPLDMPLGDAFFEQYCINTIRGFEAIAEWTSNL